MEEPKPLSDTEELDELDESDEPYEIPKLSIEIPKDLFPENHGKPWTEEEEKQLSWDWGVVPLYSLAKRFKRTPLAVWRKADSMGLGRASRGHTSLSEFARITGFSPEKIKKSARILGMKLSRALASEPYSAKDRTRTIIIEEDQKDQLIEFMMKYPFVYANEGPNAKLTRAGVWGVGKKPKECLKCKRDTRPHFAKGYCAPCYNVIWFRKKREKALKAIDPKAKIETRPKLTREQVIALREERATKGTPYKELCKKYKISMSSVSRLVTGKLWPEMGGSIASPVPRAKKGSST